MHGVLGESAIPPGRAAPIPECFLAQDCPLLWNLGDFSGCLGCLLLGVSLAQLVARKILLKTYSSSGTHELGSLHLRPGSCLCPFASALSVLLWSLLPQPIAIFLLTPCPEKPLSLDCVFCRCYLMYRSSWKIGEPQLLSQALLKDKPHQPGRQDWADSLRKFLECVPHC